jgi:hypothetical protein
MSKKDILNVKVRFHLLLTVDYVYLMYNSQQDYYVPIVKRFIYLVKGVR